MDINNKFLTTKELSEKMGLHRSTISRWIKMGKITSKNIGGHHRFDFDLVLREINEFYVKNNT